MIADLNCRNSEHPRRRALARNDAEDSPRGRRTLGGRGGGDGQGKKITVSRLFPRKSRWPNSLSARCRSVSGPKLAAELQARAEVVEVWLAARYETCSDGSSLDIADKIIGGSNGSVRREIDSDGLRRASLGESPFRELRSLVYRKLSD